jgi:Fic family protein
LLEAHNHVAVLDYRLECLQQFITVEDMHFALGDLEKFIHPGTELLALVRAAMIHYQFKASHPFWDGNGKKIFGSTAHKSG